MNGSGVPDLPVHLSGVVPGPQIPKNHPDVPTRTLLGVSLKNKEKTKKSQNPSSKAFEPSATISYTALLDRRDPFRTPSIKKAPQTNFYRGGGKDV